MQYSYFLYSEASNWPAWQSSLVAAGFDKYASGHDGYAFFFSLKFSYLKPGDKLGIQIVLPNFYNGTLATGFGFISKGNNNYDTFSYARDLNSGQVIRDETWLCDSVPNGDKATTLGFCYDFLPSVSGPGVAYRFNTRDVLTIQGWRNISGNYSIFDLGYNLKLLEANNIKSVAMVLVAI